MTGFVDPSSLSLPSSSLKRPASPADSFSDPESPISNQEPPRKRPRSAVTPEERKEARAHRNRIAAQNSRDRRKAQFVYLERRVSELEEENRRLRAGFPTSPSLSVTTVSEPDGTIEREQEQQRKREEEQRERENQELRERIRTLEKGYEAVVRALAAQGNNTSFAASISPSQASSAPSNPQSSQAATPAVEVLKTSASSSPSATISSPAPSFPHSPASSHSTLVDSPLMFASEYYEFPPSPTLSLTQATSSSSTSLALPKESLDLSLANSAPTCHLARVANTVVNSTVSLQRVGGARLVMGPASTAKRLTVTRLTSFEDEAASDAAITRLFAEILASPPLGSSTLPSSSTSSEDAFSEEVLTRIETKPLEGLTLGLDMSGIDTDDWAEQVRAEIEMEKLLEMLPNAQDVAIDANPHLIVNPDVDVDFSSAIAWDGVSVC